MMSAIFHRDQVAARMVARSHLALARSLKDGEAKDHHLKFVAEVQDWLYEGFQPSQSKVGLGIVPSSNLSVSEAWR